MTSGDAAGMNRTVLRSALSVLALALPLALVTACSGDRAQGLAPAKHTGGPHVVFDVLRQPLPEIPLPNDFATRLDPGSPTGRRINVGLDAVTGIERKTRTLFSHVDGFGTFGAITVAFDAPLDVVALRKLHSDDDFRNDAVYLLNVDPGCGSHFGDEVAVDIGRGRYPVVLEHKNVLFEADPHADDNNLLFEEHNEDTNGNGVLDPGEDLDFDDVLDVANLDDPTACDGLPATGLARDRCIADHLLTFYERQTNTLILRPVWPLEQRCTYAVVLTDRLLGANGRAVESPFDAVNARDQTVALGPVGNLLGRYGLDLDHVAFAWTFTTGSMTGDLEAVRQGLYGSGPFARFGTEFPVESLTVIPPKDPVANGALLEPGACADQALTLIESSPSFAGTKLVDMCAWGADLQAIAGYVWGTFKSPNFLLDKDGIATPKYPADDDESFDLDPVTGRAYYGSADVTWWCTLPRKAAGCVPGNPSQAPFCPPFPVIFYGHGYTNSRAEIEQFAGRQAAMGAATCGVDAFGHGYNVFLQLGGPSFPAAMGLYDVRDFANIYAVGRDRDLNNDGIADPGGDFWTNDLFHTRDALRQTIVDYMQFFRILRAFDGRMDAAGHVLGDFDADGEPDFGGPTGTVSAWGISLGGITTGILGGIEPTIDAVAPQSSGAGLTDVGLRSIQGGVLESVILPVVGPFVEGSVSPTSGTLEMGFLVNDLGNHPNIVFADVDEVQKGDRIEVTNLVNHTTRYAIAAADRSFRVEIPADALSATQKRPLLGLTDDSTMPVPVADATQLGDTLEVVVKDGATLAPKRTVATFEIDATFQGAIFQKGQPLVAIQGGLGMKRQSPDMRRFFGLAQHAIDPSDPANYAPHYFQEPLHFDYDPNARPFRRSFVQPTGGDLQVPVNTGIALARAAGILGSTDRDPSQPAAAGWRKLFAIDPRYGESMDQILLDTHYVEDDPHLERQPDAPAIFPQAILDVDVLGDGTQSFHCTDPVRTYACTLPAGVDPTSDAAKFKCPTLNPPLRPTIALGDGTFHAMRIPLLRPIPKHGIDYAQPWQDFDANSYMLNMTTRYLITRGAELVHRTGVCADCTTTAVPQYVDPPGVASPTGAACDATTQKICPASCTAQLGLAASPEPLVCQ